MSDDGLLSAPEREAWYVRRGGSVVAVLDIEESEVTRAAARGVIDALPRGEEQFVIVTRAATVALKMDDVRREVRSASLSGIRWP